MLLAIDASSIVAESLRNRGLDLIADPHLELAIASPTWEEAEYELERRMRRHLLRRGVDRKFIHRMYARATTILSDKLIVVEAADIQSYLPEALRRIPRDPRDAPTVALALALGCGIWTADLDFFGCGVAVWSSDVLRGHFRSTAS